MKYLNDNCSDCYYFSVFYHFQNTIRLHVFHDQFVGPCWIHCMPFSIWLCDKIYGHFKNIAPDLIHSPFHAIQLCKLHDSFPLKQSVQFKIIYPFDIHSFCHDINKKWNNLFILKAHFSVNLPIFFRIVYHLAIALRPVIQASGMGFRKTF